MGSKVEFEVRGAYKEATDWMRKKQIYTKSELLAKLVEMGKTDTAAQATAVVLLSPRLESKRGDCRGNMSNPWGHLAYNDKITRKEVDGKKEEQRFRFRLRATELEPLQRSSKKVDAEKVKVVEAKKVDNPVIA